MIDFIPLLFGEEGEELEAAAHADLDRKVLTQMSLTKGGLLSNSLRWKAWPILLGIINPPPGKDKIDPNSKNSKLRRLQVPQDAPNVSQAIKDLVRIDVMRVLKRFPPGLSEPQQDTLQSYLITLICAVLEKNPSIHYYQGFHDIALTFLLIFLPQKDNYTAYQCLNRLVQNHLNPFMEQTMEKTHNLIHVLFAIIEVEDKELFKRIVVDSKCPVAFCLSWVLCWFAHTLPNDTDIFRLYDFILGATERINPPCLIPVFISTSLILRNSKAIKENVQDNELATMHHELAQLPGRLEAIEPWLEESTELMTKYAGREQQMMTRAIEIRTFQNQLWDEPVNNNRGRRRKPQKWVSALSRSFQFLFVKHSWYTLAIVVLGTAFLVQYKYGYNTDNWPSLTHQLGKLSLGLSYFAEKIGNLFNSFSQFEIN